MRAVKSASAEQLKGESLYINSQQPALAYKTTDVVGGQDGNILKMIYSFAFA